MAAQSTLANFLRTNAGEILQAWDEFAATVTHDGAELDKETLRDHAGQILQVIAADLDRPQTEAQQEEKSRGFGYRVTGQRDTAAETHADTRMVSGFSIEAMITEYRALRASVLRLWEKSNSGAGGSGALAELTRFNEAIDQAIAESVARYTDQTRKSTDLFIGILGHDIRSPLGAIRTSVEYLVRSGQLTEKTAKPIINSATRIGRVIEHVVDFTRSQSDGMMPVALKQGDLREHFGKVVEETAALHPDRVVRLSSEGTFEGLWDEGRMGQLLSNLLGNAFAYGARDSDVTVRMQADASGVEVSVHNTGDPIAPEDCARIFKPLMRGLQHDAAQERRHHSGLGLGLFICQEIVRAHGGTIAVRSDAQSGTSFTVKMPRRRGAAAPRMSPE